MKKMFTPKSDHEEQLKLPIMDYLFTRYVYYNFARWTNRLMSYLGARQEWSGLEFRGEIEVIEDLEVYCLRDNRGVDCL